MLTGIELDDALKIERERRRRLRIQVEGPKFDWYGKWCGCPEMRRDGGCTTHPRARPNQRPPEKGGVFVNTDKPPVDWENWLLLAGRGFGKSRAANEWAIDIAKTGPPGTRIALVGHQASDVRDITIEGESGILAISPPWFMPKYFPSKRRLVWPNGAMGFTYSSQEPGQFRGPQFHAAVCDEAAKWENPDECYDNLQFGMRLGRKENWIPRAAWSTTPLPIPLIRMLLNDPKTVVSRGSTFENEDNLSRTSVERFRRKYEGTRLGRQELYAEVLEDVPGALWKGDLIEKYRLKDAPDMSRIVVGVDPSGSSAPRKGAHEEDNRAETGIVVAGRADVGDHQGDHYYILDDVSLMGSPSEWGGRAVGAYNRWRADRIVGEKNFGGDMVEFTIRTVDADVPYTNVWASRGKAVRAEPIAALMEQGRVHHVGIFTDLENQMCSFVQGARNQKSPDRMDAMVWAIHELEKSAPATYGEFPFPDFRG